MRTEIVNVQHAYLARFVESFLFFSKSDATPTSYVTFPNTNLCLAIYADSGINYSKGPLYNLCELHTGGSLYQSRLYGFHERPFHARLNAPLDQICILFRPGALRSFTKVPYEDLLQADNIFDAVFSPADKWVLEKVFNEQVGERRAKILEDFLLKKLAYNSPDPRVCEAIQLIHQASDNNVRMEDIAKRCGVNPSTLYRLFSREVGQSPKAFFQTVRFRKVLQQILHKEKEPLISVAYNNAYYDQAHFNKEIKTLSGFRPGQLRKVINQAHEKLVWILDDQIELHDFYNSDK